MPTCSRCASIDPNPACYVCAESEDSRESREEREAMLGDHLRDEMIDRMMDEKYYAKEP